MPLTKVTQNVIEGIVSTGSTGVSAGSFIVGQQYKITALGTTTQAQWNTIAGTTGQTYVVGSLFIAVTDGASSGTGAAAVARTLANRFADVVNVLDFGADPTGVVDSFSAFVAALNSTGTTILVPNGTYTISSNALGSVSKWWVFSQNATLITNEVPAPGFKPTGQFYGKVIPARPYGPFCIANPSSVSTIAGEATGLRVSNNQFPELTPGANDRVLASFTVNNENLPIGSLSVWGLNIVSNQISGQPECRTIGAEIEIARNKGDNSDASSNPYQGFVSTGVQITGKDSGATGGKTTAAISTWANDITGQKWFQNGIAISRTTKWGLLFKQNPDDWNSIIDTGTFLGGKTTDGSCVRVEGNATSIISSSGSHNNVIDLSQSPSPGFGVFCKMPTYGNVAALFVNYADYNNHISVSSGNTAATQSGIIFEDRGTAKWRVQKLSDNRFQIYGVLNNVSPVLITEGGEMQIGGDLVPQVDNSVSCGKSGNRWSAIWAANGTIQTSDEREKTEIKNSELGLDFITSLRPVSYKFKVGGNIVSEKDENGLPIKIEPKAGIRTHFGLIAQEVKSAIPDGVDFGGWILTDKNNPDSEQGLRYEEFIAPLIKAIQQQQKQIEELSAEVTALKSK